MPDQVLWDSSHHIRCHGQNPDQKTPQWPWGCGSCLRPCGHHVTIMQPHATHATSSADPLASGPEGPNPLYFLSISISLHANASLLAPQWSYAYLFSFLTWRPIICTHVPCSHPCPFTSMQTAALVTDTLQPPSQ